MSKPLNLIRSCWGVSGPWFKDASRSFDEFLYAVSSDGWRGIEIPLVFALDIGEKEFKEKLSKYKLDVIFQIFTDGPVAPGHLDWNNRFPSHPIPEYNVNRCIDVFKAQVEDCLKFNPLKINSHSLRDFFSFNEAQDFFNIVLPFQQSISVPILHETHRKRFFHSPWVCRDFILKNNNFGVSELLLTADLSHFTCVAETDPNDEILSDVIFKLSKYVNHIHGRVGYDHGPQVSDPRAPEWLNYTEGFEKWWDKIFEEQLNNKYVNHITFAPEHGPPNYQQTIPYSYQPLANIWDVNTWIANRTKERFQKKFANKKDL